MLKADLRTTDTKERVIQEARRLYLAGGYSYLNLDTIARTLNITRPALYFHFPGGKEQLLQGVIEAVATEVVGQLRATAAEGSTAREKFKNIMRFVASTPLIDVKEMCQAELENLSLETRRKMQGVFQQVSQVITAIIEDGITGGELRRVDPNIAVFSFIGLCQQTVLFVSLRHQLSPEMNQIFPENIEEMIDALLDLWFDGVAGPG